MKTPFCPVFLVKKPAICVNVVKLKLAVSMFFSGRGRFVCQPAGNIVVLTLPKDKSLYEIQIFITEACSEVRVWAHAPSHVLLFRSTNGGKGLEMIICETHLDNLQSTLEYMSQPCYPSFKESQNGFQSDERQLELPADQDKHKTNEREESPQIDGEALGTSMSLIENVPVAAPESDAQHADEIDECRHQHYPAMSSQMSYSSAREATAPTPRNALVDMEAEILCEENIRRHARTVGSPQATVPDAPVVHERADKLKHDPAKQQQPPNEPGAPSFNFVYSGKSHPISSSFQNQVFKQSK